MSANPDKPRATLLPTPAVFDRIWADAAVGTLRRNPGPLAIDMRTVERLDSGQLACLLQVQKEMTGNRLILAGPSSRLKDMLVLMECDRSFELPGWAEFETTYNATPEAQ